MASETVKTHLARAIITASVALAASAGGYLAQSQDTDRRLTALEEAEKPPQLYKDLVNEKFQSINNRLNRLER